MFRIALWCGSIIPSSWALRTLHLLIKEPGVQMMGLFGSASPPASISILPFSCLMSFRTDAILVLTCEPLPFQLVSSATQSVWKIWAGGRPLADPWVAFETLRDRKELITLSLVSENSCGSVCIKQAVLDVSPYSLSKTRAWLFARAAWLPVWAIRSVECNLPFPEVGDDTQSAPVGRLRVMKSMSALTAKRALKKVFFPDQWLLAYRFADPGDGFDGEGYSVIIPPPDRFWADPWVIEREGRYWIFFEDYSYSKNRGHIAAMPLDENGVSGTPVVVLEKQYHMSYPCLFEWNNDLYMLPETTGAGRVELYRCLNFPADWEPAGVLIHEVALHDPTIWESGGRWWLAGVVACEPAPPHEALHVYHAANPLGPWLPHSGNPVLLDVRSARPAGAVMSDGDLLYRPSQDCTRYGRAVVINQLRQLDADTFSEQPLYRLVPSPDSCWEGVHTVSRAGRLTVIDVLRSRPWRLLKSVTEKLTILSLPESRHKVP